VFAQSCSTDEHWGSGVWTGGEGESVRVREWRWDRHGALRLGVGRFLPPLRMLVGPQEPSGHHPLPAP